LDYELAISCEDVDRVVAIVQATLKKLQKHKYSLVSSVRVIAHVAIIGLKVGACAVENQIENMKQGQFYRSPIVPTLHALVKLAKTLASFKSLLPDPFVNFATSVSQGDPKKGLERQEVLKFARHLQAQLNLYSVDDKFTRGWCVLLDVQIILGLGHPATWKLFGQPPPRHGYVCSARCSCSELSFSRRQLPSRSRH